MGRCCTKRLIWSLGCHPGGGKPQRRCLISPPSRTSTSWRPCGRHFDPWYPRAFEKSPASLTRHSGKGMAAKGRNGRRPCETSATNSVRPCRMGIHTLLLGLRGYRPRKLRVSRTCQSFRPRRIGAPKARALVRTGVRANAAIRLPALRKNASAPEAGVPTEVCRPLRRSTSV
jgi:hypothetical protein